MGHSRAQGLNCLRVRFEILGQAAILLLIDIELTTVAQQSAWPVYGQNIAESAYMTSHVIMSNLLCLVVYWSIPPGTRLVTK